MWVPATTARDRHEDRSTTDGYRSDLPVTPATPNNNLGSSGGKHERDGE